MAKIKLETKQFLTDLGFSVEEMTPDLVKAFEPRMDKASEMFMRQTDYDKAFNELKTEQGKITEKQTRLDAEAAEWATLTAAEKENHLKLQSELDKAQQRALVLQQRVTRIATDAGLDPVKALEGIDQEIKKPEPKVDAIDTSKFVERDMFNRFNNYMFNLATELPALAAEHFALTGEQLDTRALRAELEARSTKKDANMDPRAVWEEKFGIPEKRTAKATEERRVEIEQAEKRGFEKARSEAALPIPSSGGVHSPVLRNANGEGHKSVLGRPVPESGVAAAASALATGKYRQPAAAGAR